MIQTDILPDPWRNLAGAVLEQAVCDLASHRLCQPGDVTHNLCRNGVHSCARDADGFLRSDWGAFLIDETGLDQTMFLRLVGRVAKEN